MGAKSKFELPRDADGRVIMDAYARMSVGFDGKEENVDNQFDDIEALAGRVNVAVGERLFDGLSAWKRGVRRPDWEKLIWRMENGLSGGALIWHVDRLMRLPRDLERLLSVADERALRLASVHGQRDLSDPDDRFILRIEVAHACRSSDDTSRRSRRKNEGRRTRGMLVNCGPRAFGWPGWERGKRFEAMVPNEVVEAEREAIKWAVDRLLVGGTLAEVARAWNAAGLLSFYGTPWETKTVGQALRKQRHAGRIEYEGEVVGEIADHEPTVDPEKFDRLQELFASRKRGRPVTGKHLASGLIRCSRCDTPMTSRPRYRSNGEAVPGYRCNPPKGCNRMQIDQEPVDRMLRALAIRRLSDPKVAMQVSKVVAMQNDRIATVRAELETARETEIALAEKLKAKQISFPAFEVAQEGTFADIQALEKELAELEASAADQGAMQARSRTEVADEWDEAKAAGDIERLRRMLKAALRQVRVEILPAEQGRMTPPEKRIRVRRIGGIHNTNADAGVGPDSK